MRSGKRLKWLVLFAVVSFVWSSATVGAAKKITIPPKKSSDLRLFDNGKLAASGVKAVKQIPQADLVLYLAGNQFMAMADVLAALHKDRPEIKRVFVETLPPGLILRQILRGGAKFKGTTVPAIPDVYASVNIGHLKKLSKKGLMKESRIYLHNKLAIMVGKGNPKKIKSPVDFVKTGIKNSHPNLTTEGIAKFYISAMWKQYGGKDLFMKISNGKTCYACDAGNGRTWFTQVHHRETPERILDGRAHAGIVWVTEILHAQRSGLAVEGIEIPAPYNMARKVNYAIGALTKGRNRANAEKYLKWLGSASAKSAYKKHGFVTATDAELKAKVLK